MQNNGRGGYYPPAIKKRVLSLLLTMAMLLSFVPISASAATVSSGTCGENLTWTLDDNGTLTISGTGAMWDWEKLRKPSPWNSSGKNINTVKISYGVTSIGDSAFYYCESLTSISIPNSVTSIGDYAFYYCESLTSISIPSSVASIGEGAFSFCFSLTNVNIPNSVTGIGVYVFKGCLELTSVSIPNSVTSIGYGAFSGCMKLANISIPSSVTSISSAAFNNTAYYNNSNNWENGERDNGGLYIGNYLICFVSNIKGSYSVKTGTVCIADGAFLDSQGDLTSVRIPSSVKYIGSGAFESCESLTSISIPNSVISIGDEAFYSCESLASISIPSSITSIGYGAFLYCSKLTNINVDSNNAKYTSVDGNLFNKNKTELIQYAPGKTDKDYIIPNCVKSIGDSAFEYCTNLTSISIPSSVTSIGDWAFEYCSNLINVYYGGSEAEWNNVKIGDRNQDLLNATIHYNCEEETAEIKSVSPVSSSNGVYKFKIEFDNINQSGVLVAALYKNGVMQGYETVNILPGMTSSTITVTAGTADSARIFVWGSLETMKPLCEAKSINI